MMHSRAEASSRPPRAAHLPWSDVPQAGMEPSWMVVRLAQGPFKTLTETVKYCRSVTNRIGSYGDPRVVSPMGPAGS